MKSIIDFLEHWTERDPTRRLSTYLDIAGNEIESYTYLGFRDRTRHLAAYLSSHVGLKKGDRALLIYPPGLEISAAFIACAHIGVLPVPVYPPLASFDGLDRVRFVVNDCQATAALTTTALRALHASTHREGAGSSGSAGHDPLQNLVWISTDEVQGQGPVAFEERPGQALFLQYTSGSTSHPKGVVVSHENVIHNARATTDHQATGVSWLPQYHDMGLIGYHLFPLIVGATTYGFSPLDFLRRPLLWLETISRVRATYSSGPNFAFDYCMREDKVPSAHLEGLDLSSLRVLMNASEPARARTCERFLERFSSYGLQPEALVVAYGLAENTLAATHYGRRTLCANKQELQRGRACIEEPPSVGAPQRVMSCGRPVEGVRMKIVDPKTHAALPDGQVGEVWLSGRSVCQGYWNKPALTQEVFQNALAREHDDGERYLRTGDLGFRHEGELFVCGRLKDLIIIRGVNHYPQDIEMVVEASSPKLKPGGVVAFDGGLEAGGSLVLLAEVRDPLDLPDPVEVLRALRAQCQPEPVTIAFASARTILRTTSGKLARRATRQRWLDGSLPLLAVHSPAREHQQARASSLATKLRELLDTLGASGDETRTLGTAGLDSLTRVAVVADVETLLKNHGAGNVAAGVDIQALEALELSVIWSLLERVETQPDDAIGDFRRALAAARRKRDDRELVRMLADAQLNLDSRVEPAAGRASLADILLTGATGFFGPFLLNSLLQRTDFVYHVLIRADGPEHGMNRIRQSMRQARLWTPGLDDTLQRRVRIACGDVAKPNLGLSAEAWGRLSLQIQGVIHNAASVNYVRSYEELRSTNVEGTRELIRFSLAGTRKELDLISSTIIHGWTAKELLLETDANSEMKNLDFGYAQTKWVSEQLVFTAARQGLASRIYRPSFISASSAGVASRDDIIIRLLAFMLNHGVAVKAHNQLSFLPAHVAADNIAAIFGAGFRTPSLDTPVFNVVTSQYYSMEDVTRLITQTHGHQFEYYDIPSFVAEMRRRSTPDDLVYPLLDFFGRAVPKVVAMQDKRYSNERYLAARRACGGLDEPSLQLTVSYLMTFLVQEGVVRLTP